MRRLLSGLVLVLGSFGAQAILSTEPSVDTPIYLCEKGRCYCTATGCYTTTGVFLGKGKPEDVVLPDAPVCNQELLACSVLFHYIETANTELSSLTPTAK